MSGYSKTPLVKKIGYKDNSQVAIIDAPASYKSEIEKGNLANLMIFSEINDDTKFDLIHVFRKSARDLEDEISTLKNNLAKDGMLWISWPKKASKMKTDLNENLVRKIGLATGLVDIKVAAIDEIWSGLKFVYRLKDR